jgi:chondroitin AC lyase
MQPDLSGARFYWDSEYFSFQRPDYFTSVRMFSSRNHSMEIPYNSEGLMNHHYADGSNFISRTGEEYYDIFPVYDWQKIPGTTILGKRSLPPDSEIQQKGLTDFVGAVTDDNYGAAAFDFISPLDPLKAKKAWFFFDKEYVCLGAGISSGSDSPVVTTINQCLLKGDVIVMKGNSRSVMKHGESTLENVKWLLHDSVGYLFPEPINAGMQNHFEKGSWYLINHQSDSPKDEVTKDVFKLWLEHGAQPENADYQYIVVPCTNEKEMTGSVNNRNIEILANTSEIQAVRHNGLGICQVVFYKSGIIRISPDIILGTDSPGIVMIRYENGKISSISVSDPSRKLGKMHLTLSVKIEKNVENFSSEWDEQIKVSNISIKLPGDVYAGKSLTFIVR